MALSTTNVDVGTTETSLITANATSGSVVKIQPLGNEQIFIGLTGVTTSTGFLVRGVAEIVLAASEELFGIAESGTKPTRVLAWVNA